MTLTNIIVAMKENLFVAKHKCSEKFFIEMKTFYVSGCMCFSPLFILFLSVANRTNEQI
jgi:heme/copper-type cytochrome/quinol oxidase subunit 3